MSIRNAAVLFAVVGLAACATRPPSSAPPPTERLPPPSTPISRPEAALSAPSPFAALVGWAGEDHAAALAAWRAACPPSSALCALARSTGVLDEAASREFLERRFRLDRIAVPGLLTAYFMPIYEARSRSGGDFTAPVRPRPADLGPGPYTDRANLEARLAPDALAWMRPEDLFFLQIQGSGVLNLEGGRTARAVVDGTNNAAFRGVAATLRAQGQLADNDTSAEAIHVWLAAHRGASADAVMQTNPRYVFFRLTDDDGGQPLGAARTPLIPGRSVAVDPAYHPMGALLWLDATGPSLKGAFPSYRRLVVAQDIGGAIKGPARADLFLGRGPAAGVEAGRVRHSLTLYRLVPRDTPAL